MPKTYFLASAATFLSLVLIHLVCCMQNMVLYYLSVLHALCDLSSAVGVSDKLHVTWLTDKTQFLSCIYDFAIIWLSARRLITRYRSKLPKQFEIEERASSLHWC